MRRRVPFAVVLVLVVVALAAATLLARGRHEPCRPTEGAGNADGHGCREDPMSLREGSIPGNRDGTPGTRAP